MRKRNLAIIGMTVALGSASLCGCASQNTKQEETSSVIETAVDTESTAETTEEVADKGSGKAQDVVLDGFEDKSIENASESDIEEFNKDNPYFSINASVLEDKDVTLHEITIPGTDRIAYVAGIQTKESDDTEETDSTSEDGEISIDGGAATILVGYKNTTSTTKEQFDALKTKVGEGDALTKDDYIAWANLFGAGALAGDIDDIDASDMADLDDEALEQYAGLMSNKKVSGVPFVQLGINFFAQMNFGTSLADNDAAYIIYDISFGDSNNLNDVVEFKDVKEHHKSDKIAPEKETEADDEDAEDIIVGTDN